MQFTDKDKIKATILYHLRRKNIIGEKHTHYDTLKRGFPSHLGKDIEKAAKELIMCGWILTKPAAYGLQVSLNKYKLREIEEFIMRILGFKF